MKHLFSILLIVFLFHSCTRNTKEIANVEVIIPLKFQGDVLVRHYGIDFNDTSGNHYKIEIKDNGNGLLKEKFPNKYSVNFLFLDSKGNLTNYKDEKIKVKIVGEGWREINGIEYYTFTVQKQ